MHHEAQPTIIKPFQRNFRYFKSSLQIIDEMICETPTKKMYIYICLYIYISIYIYGRILSQVKDFVRNDFYV